jgi:hypothetical protein
MPSTGEDDGIWTRRSASQTTPSHEMPERRGEQRSEQTGDPSSPRESANRMLHVQETSDTYVVPTLGYDDDH